MNWNAGVRFAGASFRALDAEVSRALSLCRSTFTATAQGTTSVNTARPEYVPAGTTALFA